MTPAGGSTG
ncbi:uncharacterized protein FFM5_15369 [Fusarium fujikuroi]|nr:uncharacterized protein FFM5_15369 [Fusarium fujikuroi]